MKTFEVTARDANGLKITQTVYAKSKADALKMVSPIVFKHDVRAVARQSVYKAEYYLNWGSRHSGEISLTGAAFNVLDFKRKMAKNVQIKDYSIKFVKFVGAYDPQQKYENFIQLD